MDILTLAMAKPKVLDLTKFYLDGLHGVTLGDMLMSTFAKSLQNGGTLQTIENLEVVANPSIQQQATTNRDTYIVKMNALGNEMRIPAAYVGDSRGAGQLPLSGMVAVPDVGVVAMQAYIQFMDAPNKVNIGVKATIL